MGEVSPGGSLKSSLIEALWIIKSHKSRAVSTPSRLTGLYTAFHADDWALSSRRAHFLYFRGLNVAFWSPFGYHQSYSVISQHGLGLILELLSCFTHPALITVGLHQPAARSQSCWRTFSWVRAEISPNLFHPLTPLRASPIYISVSFILSASIWPVQCLHLSAH